MTAERTIVYISGRITGDENYKESFERAERFLREKGYIVLNPAKLDLISPELNYSEYMAICYRLIDISDIIFMVGDWRCSKGASSEISYAKSLGKKVAYQNYFSPFRKGAKCDEKNDTEKDAE